MGFNSAFKGLKDIQLHLLIWDFTFYNSVMFHVLRTRVTLLIEALRYKSEGRGFDSRWCHWNFPLT